MNKAIIDRNRAELMQLLAYLFTYIGLADDVSDAERATDRRDRALRGMALPATISRRLHKTISQLLKPMEAAVRRLIVAMAALLPPVVLRPFEMKPRPTPKPDLPRTFDASAMVPACLAPSVGPPLPSHTRAYSPRFSLFDPLRFKTYVCDANEPAPSVDWSKFPADPMNEHTS